jgi:hypothetical protein
MDLFWLISRHTATAAYLRNDDYLRDNNYYDRLFVDYRSYHIFDEIYSKASR